MERFRSRVGKQVGGALYVHLSAVDRLLPEQSRLIAAAAEHVPKGNWNVAKIDLADDRAVSLLDYEDFAEHAFPALRQSHRVDLKAGVVSARRYEKNPPILHRKELLLSPDAPRRDLYVALTQELERRGLFVDMNRRGRLEAWESALAEAGIEVRDHQVVAAGPPVDVRIPAQVAESFFYDGMSPVARHRTAIGRNGLSAPMAALNAAGLLDDGVSVLDYGCGRGDESFDDDRNAMMACRDECAQHGCDFPAPESGENLERVIEMLPVVRERPIDQFRLRLPLFFFDAVAGHDPVGSRSAKQGGEDRRGDRCAADADFSKA